MKAGSERLSLPRGGFPLENCLSNGTDLPTVNVSGGKSRLEAACLDIAR